MSLWILLALLSAVCSSIPPLIDKVLLRTRKIDPTSLAASRMVVNTLILAVISVTVFRFDFASVPWGHVLLLSLVFTVAVPTYFLALRKDDISKLVPFREFVTILLSFLIAVAFLHETASVRDYIGVFAIMAGVFIVLSNGVIKHLKSVRPSHGLFLIGISGIALALFGILGKILSSVHAVLLALLMYSFVSVLLVTANAIWNKKSQVETMKFLLGNGKKLALMLLSSLGAVAATTSLFFALSMANAAEVLPVSRTTPVFTVLLGWLLLREKYGPQRMIGTLVLFSGVVLIYL